MPVTFDTKNAIDKDGNLTEIGQKILISYLGFIAFMSNRMAKDEKFRQEIVKAYGDEPEIVIKKMRVKILQSYRAKPHLSILDLF